MHFADLQTPCLLIRLDRVRENLARMSEMLDGRMERWRPHVKTAKIPEVLSLLLETGVRRFKCATGREARVLLERAGQPIDLLVAMSHRGANRERVVELAAAFPDHHLSLLSEDPAHAGKVQAAGLGVFVDLDPGYHRSGIPLEARERISRTVRSAGSCFRGFHYYDGHLHDLPPAEREAVSHRDYARLLDCISGLGGGGEEIVTSGTPTFPGALGFAPFGGRDHTVSPGTVVYWDLKSEQLGIPGFRYAAFVQTRVISQPLPQRVTCDAGSKSVDAAAGDPCAQVLGRQGLRPLTPSEEHLPLQVLSGSAPAPGELLLLVPRHVCPTINLADEAVLLEGEEVVGIVPVSARGHEAGGPTLSLP